MSNFCIIQGEIIRDKDFVLSPTIAFGMGDKLIETVRLYNTHALFLKQHITNLKDTMDVLAMPYPQGFDFESIAKQISRLLNINKIYKGGICKIVISRNADVFNELQTQESTYAIFIQALPQLEFEFNAKGKRLALLQSAIIEKPHLYSMYSAHMLVQNKTNAIIKKTGVDTLGFFNANGTLFHTSGGDFMYVKNNKIYYPSIEVNTFRHPLTDYILQLMDKNSYELIEKNIIQSDDLLESDEMFLIHPISGIQWVVSCNESKFSFTASRKIYKLLEQNLQASF